MLRRHPQVRHVSEMLLRQLAIALRSHAVWCHSSSFLGVRLTTFELPSRLNSFFASIVAHRREVCIVTALYSCSWRRAFLSPGFVSARCIAPENTC